MRTAAMCGLMLCGLLTGCGDKGDGKAQTPQPAPAAQSPQTAVSHANGAAPSAAIQISAETYARLHQSFKDATLAEPPGESDTYTLPPETITRKSVGKLYETVVAEWTKVPFVTPAGKKLAYTATIATDLGNITIELWPELAPNHVRNFVALARAGYYDGLQFDRVVKTELEDKKCQFIEYVEAGCPMGTGEVTYGSIGYWLKPEFSDTVKHEEGSVGAWHDEELESAACKFYITLSKAEWMDGNFTLFGKITQGLEIARAIHRQPVQAKDGDRPVDPVVIRSVTIVCREQP